MLSIWIAGLGSVLPPVDQIWCHKNAWVGAALSYVGPCAEAANEELSQKRRICGGYFKYRMGYSPQEHADLQKQLWGSIANRWTVIIGAGVGGLTGASAAFLLKNFFG